MSFYITTAESEANEIWKKGLRKTIIARSITMAILLVVSYAYFYQAGGWNQNSRFAMVRAIVEHGTLSIDAYHEATGDKARVGQHYYSDKAPGLSLTAVPVYLSVRPFILLGGVDPGSPAAVTALSYIVTLATSGVPTVITSLLLFLLGLRLGASSDGGAFAAIVFGLGTPAWAYATLFWGSSLASACLVVAFSAAVALEYDGTARRDAGLGVLVGLGGGWATITEFTAAVPAMIVATFAVTQVWLRSAARLTTLLAIIVGASVAAAVLLTYNNAAFHSPFAVSYRSVLGFEGMKEGFFGLTYPKLDVLRAILLGPYRGLLLIAPVMGFALFGLLLIARQPGKRAVSLSATLIIIYYVGLNASYRYWHGGWSYGPRHLASALPFMALFLAILWSHAKPLLRTMLAVLAVWGVAMSLVAVATTAQVPERIQNPVWQFLWPAFRDGDFSLNHESFIEANADFRRLRGGELSHDAWNVGEKLGLRGHASLLPLYFVWAGCLAAWIWLTKRRVELIGEAAPMPTSN